MKYLILGPRRKIESAVGFTPANSIPLPQHLEAEEAEWLVVQDIVDVVQTQVLENGEPVLDANGDAVMQDQSIVVGQEVVVNEALKTQILSAREAAQLAQQQEQALRSVLQNAVAFGTKLMEDFVMENIAMGITVDNMSEAVLDAMAPVEAALRTGTLHVALKRLKEIPVEQKDAKYITDARLLAAVNELEEYLSLPLSAEL